jgi:DNA-binding MarR family transcriptional regulator
MTPPENRTPVVAHDLGIVDGLVQLSFSIQTIFGEVTSRYDTSIVQAQLLGVLRDRELSMAQIARVLTLDKSSATGLVDRAEKKGYVLRKIAPHDGRSILVTLTTEGRRLVNRVASDISRAIKVVADGMSDADRRRLSVLASKFVHCDAAVRGIDLSAGQVRTTNLSKKDE